MRPPNDHTNDKKIQEKEISSHSIEITEEITIKFLIVTNSTDYNNITLSLNSLALKQSLLLCYLKTKHRPQLESDLVNHSLKFKQLLSSKLSNARIVTQVRYEDNYSESKLKIHKQHCARFIRGFIRNCNLLLKNYFLQLVY